MERQIAYKSDILEFLELDILCNRFGMTALYGLSGTDQEEMTTQRVYGALESLVKKQVMVSDGDHFILQPVWTKRLRCMKDPDEILQFHFYNPMAAEHVCYIKNGHVCITTYSQYREGKLSICDMEYTSLVREYLLDALPEENAGAYFMTEANLKYENTIMEELSQGLIREGVYLQCFCPSVKDEKQLYLLDDMMSEPYILITFGEKRKRIQFTSTNLEHGLGFLIGEPYDFS